MWRCCRCRCCGGCCALCESSTALKERHLNPLRRSPPARIGLETESETRSSWDAFNGDSSDPITIPFSYSFRDWPEVSTISLFSLSFNIVVRFPRMRSSFPGNGCPLPLSRCADILVEFVDCCTYLELWWHPLESISICRIAGANQNGSCLPIPSK